MFKADAEFFRIIYNFFAHGTKLTYAAMGVGLIIAILYFRIFFRNPSGFEDDLDKAGKIPIVNKDYDYVEKKWSTDKIWLWLFISVGCGILAYYQLPEWLPHLFGK